MKRLEWNGVDPRWARQDAMQVPSLPIRLALMFLVVAVTTVFVRSSADVASAKPARHPSVVQSAPCATSSRSGSPVTITLRADIQNSLIAPVCIDGQGPFHLLVDTGASATALTTSVTARLHLPNAGAPQQFFGVGRPLDGQPVTVKGWSLGSLQLAPQVVYSLKLGLPSRVDGLLGSDVLSRFGAIRLDYDQAQLIVAGSEGPVPSAQEVQGNVGHQLPAAFARYHPQTVLPLTVEEFDGAAVATAAVVIGPRTLQLEVDSGSDLSAIARSETGDLGLVPEGDGVQVQGIGSSVKAARERVRAWSFGPVHLVPEDLISVDLPNPPGTPGIDGLLGADVLSQFRAVIIDYTDGTLAVDQVPLV
jgi:predicted aspartyl protease